MNDLLIGLSELFNGTKGAALASFLGTVFFWLVNRIWTMSKKEMKSTFTQIQNDITQLKKNVNEVKYAQSTANLSMEFIKGQITLVLAIPDQMDKLKEKMTLIDSKASAAWRVLDKKRISDS